MVYRMPVRERHCKKNATLVMQAVMMHVLYMLYVGNYNAPVLGRIDKLNEKGAQAENPLPPRRTNIVSKKISVFTDGP